MATGTSKGTTLTTQRAVFPKIEATIPADVQRHLSSIYRALNNHALAFQHVSSPSTTTNTGATTGGTTLTGVASFNTRTGAITYFPGMGLVNNQSGAAAYTISGTDSGGLILLNNATPITVTLNSTVGRPWFTTIFNQGAGAATLTPTSGTINGTASNLFPGGSLGLVYYDGANWWAEAVAPIGSIVKLAYRAVTSGTTILSTDYQLECSGTFTVSLPTAAGIAGQMFSIKAASTSPGNITVAAFGGELIDGLAAQTVTIGSNMVVMSNGTGWIIT